MGEEFSRAALMKTEAEEAKIQITTPIKGFEKFFTRGCMEP
jgi:hypothetical protein